jgi:hypothetical protein
MTDRSASNTTKLSPVPISRAIFGVRYEPQFSITDYAGGVIDEILRAEGTRFGPSVFPGLDTAPNEQTLSNPETKNFLRINYQDCILGFSMDGSRRLDDLQQLGNDFATYVLQPLRQLTGLGNIIRVGMVIQLADAHKALKVKPIEKYLAPDFSNATTLRMRFTRRMAAEEGFVKKGVDDYRNVIYQIAEEEDGSVAIALDYQHFYKPMLDGAEWDERPFDKFVKSGLDYFETEFQKWFISQTNSAEVA